MPAIYEKAILLDAYYRLSSESAIGGPRFQLGNFRMGYGFLDVDGSISNIPASTSVIPAVFYTGTPVAAYAGGRTALNCIMPAGAIASSQTKAFSVIGIYDLNQDILIAIIAGTKIDLTSIDRLDISSYIDNALKQ